MITEDLKAIERMLGDRPQLPSWYYEDPEWDSFDTWCDAVEQLTDKDLTVADEERDGCSFGSAYDSWKAHISPAEYAAGRRP